MFDLAEREIEAYLKITCSADQRHMSQEEMDLLNEDLKLTPQKYV